jgi:hypothetical protein
MIKCEVTGKGEKRFSPFLFAYCRNGMKIFWLVVCVFQVKIFDYDRDNYDFGTFYDHWHAGTVQVKKQIC